MKSRADEFRDKAAECERQARSASGASARAVLLELAARWRALAEQTEEFDRKRNPKPKS